MKWRGRTRSAFIEDRRGQPIPNVNFPGPPGTTNRYRPGPLGTQNRYRPGPPGTQNRYRPKLVDIKYTVKKR